MSLPRNGELLANARKLRRDMTKEELKLWYQCLRECPVKFYKQKIIGNYIVDFYCSKARLVIELDGEQHGFEENEKYDAKRTAFLEEYDLMVLRFFNNEVNREFEAVCRTIDVVLQRRLGYDPYPE